MKINKNKNVELFTVLFIVVGFMVLIAMIFWDRSVTTFLKDKAIIDVILVIIGAFMVYTTLMYVCKKETIRKFVKKIEIFGYALLVVTLIRIKNKKRLMLLLIFLL
ncbi:hypothetical protein [Pontibacillus yanchengensis]|uniref:hypothetical protein n=1 Tax=Pontibacillus yanchengensis TaxID=462910 RepID=UPI001F1BA11F|nr:hypothetical protein [Pontibacillus yanchengensis]